MMELFIVFASMALVFILLFLGIYFLNLFDSTNKGYMRAYQCKNCGAIYEPDNVPFICKNCGKEITAKRSFGEFTADDLSMDRKITNNCRIVIAKKTLRGWVVLPEDDEK